MIVVYTVCGIGLFLILFFVGLYVWGNHHVSKVQLSTLFREMSIMIDAGMPLLRIFKILSERISHPRLKTMVGEILVSVEHGNTVAAAMATYPNVFDDMTVGVIKVGETGGVLDESLRRLSDYFDLVVRIRRKMILAWIYPAFVFLLILVILIGMVCFVFPKMMGPIKEKGLELPLPSRIVDGLGQFISGNWFSILVFTAAAGVGFYFFRRTPFGRSWIDWVKLRFPVLGNQLGIRFVAARVSSTFSTLIHCGIPMISCLRIISQTQPNVHIAGSFRRTAEVVEEGGSLVGPLEESGFYPPLMIDMLAVGDESGTLDLVLDKIAKNYAEEIDTALEALMRIQEVALIMMMGGMVLFIALAAYMPYLQYVFEAVG